MKYTKNYNFKKPEPHDTRNINDINESFDLVDAKLKETQDKNVNLDETFKQLVIDKGNNNAEIVAARRDKFNNKTYNSVPDRLDDFSGKLAQVANEKATKLEVEIERQRTNQILANPGSTSGDLALNDLKVWYDGSVSESPGDALRGQISQLSNELNLAIENNTSVVFKWEQGSFTNGLTDSSNAYRLRTKVLKIPKKTTLKITVPDGYRMNCAYIKDSTVFLGETAWLTGEITINSDVATQYRLLLEKQPVAEITPATAPNVVNYLFTFNDTKKILDFFTDASNFDKQLISLNWEVGGINATGDNQDTLESQCYYYRTSLSQLTQDIIIEEKNNETDYLMDIFFYENGVFKSKTGYISNQSYLIKAGTQFRILLRRNIASRMDCGEYQNLLIYKAKADNSKIDLLREYNLFNKNNARIGWCDPTNGGINFNRTEYVYSDLIPVYLLKSKVLNSGNYVSIFTFFDANKTYVSGIMMNTSGGGGSTYEITDSRIAYVVFSIPKANINDFVALGYKINTDITDNYDKQLRILCIGDSLTYGGISMTESTTFNYPYYLGKYLNAKIYNHGWSGYTTQMYWNNDRMAGIQFAHNYDVVLIMLGTNGGLTDTLATDVEPYSNYNDYANTNTGCYCKLIEKIMEKTNNKAQIILIIPPYHRYSEEKYQQLQDVRKVIPKIADRYCLPVIDAYSKSGMNAFNGTVFRPSDNLHFNPKGYQKLGTFIGSEVKSVYSSFDLY